MKKTNYLNNKDILVEIHKSKNSFCSYKSKEYADFDIILNDISEIPDNIEKGKQARFLRLQSTNQNLTIDDILDTDVVFRIMSSDHVPYNTKEQKFKKTKRYKNKKTVIDLDFFESDLDDVYSEIDEDVPVSKKVNFPPFIHCVLDENKTPIIVGKSHWKGDLETGTFSTTHGKITENLGRMYIALTSRYATKPNWRGYSYNDEMQSNAILQLTAMGLKFNEAKGSNPFAYFTQVITRSFYLILHSEKNVQNIRDSILEENGLNPSFSRQMLTDDE